MYTYKFMKSVRVIPVSAVLSRVPYGYVFLHMPRIRVLHTVLASVRAHAHAATIGLEYKYGTISKWPCRSRVAVPVFISPGFK